MSIFQNIAHPGRHGDLLWALPTIRELAVSDPLRRPVCLHIPEDVAGLKPLLEHGTDYLAQVVVRPDWPVEDSAPRRPRYPPGMDEHNCLALGYANWPNAPLPYEAARLGNVLDRAAGHPDHFFRPWLQLHAIGDALGRQPRLTVHWTDRYFELKLGILYELRRTLPHVAIDWYAAPGSRMAAAGAHECAWLALARLLQASTVVLTDCSAAHVLAAALGVQHVLVVEPEEARHHWIFWPGCEVSVDSTSLRHNGWTAVGTVLGRHIRPVIGGDRRITFDARHTADAVQEALRAVRR